MKESFELEKVEVAQSPLERFEEFLQSRGMRNTRQRQAIVEEIFSRHEHFDAEELLARLKENDNDIKVSRPTVYRTLTDLEEAGLLRRMTLHGRAVYEHDYGYPQHDHLYCERCHKLIEFQSDQLKEIREAAAKEHRFRVTGHRFIVYGICDECAQPRRRESRHRRLDLI